MKILIRGIMYLMPIGIAILFYKFLRTDFAVTLFNLRKVTYYVGNCVFFPIVLSAICGFILQLIINLTPIRDFWTGDLIYECVSLLSCIAVCFVIIVCLMIWGPLKIPQYDITSKVNDTEFIIVDVVFSVILGVILEILSHLFQMSTSLSD